MAIVPAYIGMGSNLHNPPRQLRQALAHLAELSSATLMQVSGFYRNPAMNAPGLAEQPDFVNAVARLDSQLSPHELLDQLQAIERRQHRQRDRDLRWGPRTLDLDLLVYGDVQLADDRLTIPHPGLEHRPFVVFPLVEIEPQLIVPGMGEIGEIAARLDAGQLLRIDS
ncbi:2-amino-4-hydroxy-6-hydroxymethyldihydropteridine pyrophosphokinase [Halorhodospira halochloris]|uniref:2-amino-4-hydroxy-6-hydroxymethyldihydropteridine pyrophosphokinase n=1 Tax=Halorhodospira halochloris TaxID=1052 RepID=A0A0X8X817_HALHR|nr:2-amino-4-hydroxy-6-hydroxymethyldihydropteridine diphosphokinase [Halorhodospira halochloris]BAU57181.1 2-amino-4-hydroxy-6-hydroxymethyldihydropteridine pyrophosphokinase [Halorhodospira halochloris]